jgi:TolA-binding protein
VDQQTKAALKKDSFVSTTTHGLEWASEHRQTVVKNGAIALAVIVVLVVGAVIYNSRSDAASVAFGDAMQVYQTPLAQAGQEVPPGMKTFPSTAERAKAANAKFVEVANKYGMTASGKNALYFAGLTEIDAGQTQQAEDSLKKVANGWDGELAALAKFALAQLYRNAGRYDEAAGLYQELMKKPTTTVPAGQAQLALADMYQVEGKTDLAKKELADLKDKDPKGPAGAAAAQKLNPAPAGPAGLPPQ